MKENKFSIEVIEQGRLSKKEISEIIGGDVYKPLCESTYFIKECYSYTVCEINQFGDRGYVNCADGPTGPYTVCPTVYRNKF